MLFNSIDFIFFFLTVIPLYFLLPYRYRVLMLLIASCYFYMFFVPIYIVILFSTIIIDYFAGILIEKSQGHKRRAWLVLSLVANIGILCYFKYFNFLNDNLTLLLQSFGKVNSIPDLTILLPIGLSFHTFQAMSYTIEVYRGNQKSERNFITYALYVMFFPQLVAGPIERPQNLLHQFKEEHKFNYDLVASGLKLMAWGLFKKVVIADRLAPMVEYVYKSPIDYTGLPLIISTFFFSVQIYCDFSGYSDIAIGSARIMGFNLMKNFDRPYASRSIPEFWRRWHISLSTWFKDYLYIPLGGNRVSRGRVYLNLLIVFLVSGLWHGASWNFIIWGGIHGLLLVIYMIASSLLKGRIAPPNHFLITLKNTLSIILVFLLTSIAWIFFRAKTFDDAYYILFHMNRGVTGQIALLKSWQPDDIKNLLYLGTDGRNLVIALASIIFLFLMEYIQAKFTFSKRVSIAKPVLRYSTYAALLLLILYYGVYDKTVQFIYFQF